MTATTHTELFCYQIDTPDKPQATINDPGKQILTILLERFHFHYLVRNSEDVLLLFFGQPEYDIYLDFDWLEPNGQFGTPLTNTIENIILDNDLDFEPEDVLITLNAYNTPVAIRSLL